MSILNLAISLWTCLFQKWLWLVLLPLDWVFKYICQINQEAELHCMFIFIFRAVWFFKCIYFWVSMSLRPCSNCFLKLRNRTGMVIPYAFHTCWRLFALDQIQVDAYCIMVWRLYEATFKLCILTPIFKETKWLSVLENHGITNPFPHSTLSHFYFSFAWMPHPGFLPRGQSILWGGHTLNCTTLLCLVTLVWMWTGNCRDVLRSTEPFQSLAPFSSFILKDFFPLRAFTFLMKLNCALNNSMTTSNILCHHVYIWSGCGHADSTWCKVPWSFYTKSRSEFVYPHNFRLVAFGRSYVEQRRNDTTSGSIAMKDFHNNLIGSISFHFVQAHYLAWVTAVTVFAPPQTSWLLHSPYLFPLWDPLWRIPCCSCCPAWLVWVMPNNVFDLYAAFHLLGGLNGWPLCAWFYFWICLPNALVGWVHHHMKAYFPNFWILPLKILGAVCF